MTPLRQTSPRDLETLSAFVDGRLSPSEEGALQRRLERDEDLRLALKEMRQTVQALRSLPSRPVPRSFALDPAMVTRPAPARWYPVFQLGTALAGVAFLLVVGLDVLGQRPFDLATRLLPAEAPMAQPEAGAASLFAAAGTPTPEATAVSAASDMLTAQATAGPPTAPSPQEVAPSVLGGTKASSTVTPLPTGADNAFANRATSRGLGEASIGAGGGNRPGSAHRRSGGAHSSIAPSGPSLNPDPVRFCPACGTPVREQEAFGRIRPVCPACGRVHFYDPKVAAGVLVEDAGRVLLVRRTQEPGRGRWTLPAGFVDAGEDPAVAAVRECREETGLEVELEGLFELVAGRAHPRGADIVIVYRGRVSGGRLKAGDDADAAAFFSPADLPDLAFDSTRRTVDRWRTGERRDV